MEERSGCAHASPDGLCFEMEDSGPGVPPKMQALLFQEFTQLEPQGSGIGLGLSLSARLAAQMGGHLSYVVGPGEVGGKFRLTLPWPATDVVKTVNEPARRHAISRGLVY